MGSISYFNPRPLAGATVHRHTSLAGHRISIHAPLRGRLCINVHPYVYAAFQSTPPCGGDLKVLDVRQEIVISIHAPLRGRPPKSR